MRHQPTTQHNYLAKLLEHAKHIPQSGVIHSTEVLHDDWCDLLAANGFCNCDPTLSTTSKKIPDVKS